MPLAFTLSDATCRRCGGEALRYWTKDETESVDEVYVDCDDCGHEFPKRVVDKTDDTPHEEIAREIAAA